MDTLKKNRAARIGFNRSRMVKIPYRLSKHSFPVNQQLKPVITSSPQLAFSQEVGDFGKKNL